MGDVKLRWKKKGGVLRATADRFQAKIEVVDDQTRLSWKWDNGEWRHEDLASLEEAQAHADIAARVGSEVLTETVARLAQRREEAARWEALSPTTKALIQGYNIWRRASESERDYLRARRPDVAEVFERIDKERADASTEKCRQAVAEGSHALTNSQ
ncbi:MAG: hypothetical protein WC683_00975 [bacterium]